jgi:hypothetical protein
MSNTAFRWFSLCLFLFLSACLQVSDSTFLSKKGTCICDPVYIEVPKYKFVTKTKYLLVKPKEELHYEEEHDDGY